MIQNLIVMNDDDDYHVWVVVAVVEYDYDYEIVVLNVVVIYVMVVAVIVVGHDLVVMNLVAIRNFSRLHHVVVVDDLAFFVDQFWMH